MENATLPTPSTQSNLLCVVAINKARAKEKLLHKKQSKTQNGKPKPEQGEPTKDVGARKPDPDIINYRSTQRTHVITSGVVVYAVEGNSCPLSLGSEIEVCSLEGRVRIGSVMNVLSLVTGKGHDSKRLLAFVISMSQ